MKFNHTPVEGMYLIDLERREDERGYFARTFCLNEFKVQGIDFTVVQSNMSFSLKKGTMRGLHFQENSHEAKVVRCTKGKIFDVVLDLRPYSSTYLKYATYELSEVNKKQVYIPPGCAHGFLTLEDGCEINYLVSAFYSAEVERGIRYTDPILKEIQWPLPIQVITDRDRSFPDF
jgi:dTDP-4-dehydrorhamnose 3,5-epimerase